jgi:hypothetical protein
MPGVSYRQPVLGGANIFISLFIDPLTGIRLHAFEVAGKQVFNDCAEADIVGSRLGLSLSLDLRIDPDRQSFIAVFHGTYL